MDDYHGYKVGCSITGIIIFLGAYIYAIVTYGIFLGGGLGWIPAFALAVIFCWFWPLYLAILLIGGAIVLFMPGMR